MTASSRCADARAFAPDTMTTAVRIATPWMTSAVVLERKKPKSMENAADTTRIFSVVSSNASMRCAKNERVVFEGSLFEPNFSRLTSTCAGARPRSGWLCTASAIPATSPRARTSARDVIDESCSTRSAILGRHVTRRRRWRT